MVRDRFMITFILDHSKKFSFQIGYRDFLYFLLFRAFEFAIYIHLANYFVTAQIDAETGKKSFVDFNIFYKELSYEISTESSDHKKFSNGRKSSWNVYQHSLNAHER